MSCGDTSRPLAYDAPMFRAKLLSVLLLGSVASAASLAACGGNESAPVAPTNDPAVSTAPPTEAPSTPDASVGAPLATAVPEVPAKVTMSPIRSSALLAKLTELKLDPKALPSLHKLTKDQRNGVMKLFAESLGISCNGCHEEGAFKNPTRRKNIASKMWDEYAVKLSMTSGEPLFCDSCHQGRAKVLDRTDKKVVAKWMGENFDQGLKQKAKGAEHGCGAAQCHKDEDYQFLTKWSGGLK